MKVWGLIYKRFLSHLSGGMYWVKWTWMESTWFCFITWDVYRKCEKYSISCFLKYQKYKSKWKTRHWCTCTFLFRGEGVVVIYSQGGGVVLLYCCCCWGTVEQSTVLRPLFSQGGFMGACAALIHDRSWNCWETTTDSLLLALRDVSWISAHHGWTVTWWWEESVCSASRFLLCNQTTQYR